MKLCQLFIYLLFGTLNLNGQSFFTPSDTLNKKRLIGVISTEAVASLGSLIVLNSVWYKQYPKSSFQLFDDHREWLQMDKVGHAMTSYYIGYAGIEALNWAGVDSKKSALYGGSLGLLYLTGLEVMDGFSANWGFSTGDMLANVAGTGLVVGQELMWEEQRIQLKVSTHLTPYATFRPNVLGSSTPERWLKDYNGQTYWLSANVSSFLPEESKFPKWLNVAVGYGAEEMISGEDNPHQYCNGDAWCLGLNRYRQWYLSLDADLTKLPIKNKFFKTVLGTFGFIKLPFPALEFNSRGVMFHPFYF